MKTEDNTMYGTYEDGPVYNTVTDENAYYGSKTRKRTKEASK